MLSRLFPRYRRASMLTTLGLLCFAITTVVLSQAYQPPVRAFPLIIAWLMIGLCILDLLAQTHTGLGRAIDHFFSGGQRQETKEEVTWSSALLVAGAIAWVIMFPLGVYFVGFMVMIPIYLFVSMSVLGNNSMVRALLTTVLVTLVVWVFFEYALGYKLFRGALAPGVMDYLGWG